MTTAERAILQLQIPFRARPGIFIPPIAGRMIWPGGCVALRRHFRTLQIRRLIFRREKREAETGGTKTPQSTEEGNAFLRRQRFIAASRKMARDEKCPGDTCLPEPECRPDRPRETSQSRQRLGKLRWIAQSCFKKTKLLLRRFGRLRLERNCDDGRFRFKIFEMRMQHPEKYFHVAGRLRNFESDVRNSSYR